MLAREMAPEGRGNISRCGAPAGGSAGSCEEDTPFAAPFFLKAAVVCAPANATHNKLASPRIPIRFIDPAFRRKFLGS